MRVLVALTALLALTACTAAGGTEAASESESASESARVESDLSSGYDGEIVAVGTEDPGIPDEIPEQIPTSPFPDVEADHLIVYEDFGLQQGAFHLVDQSDGQVGFLNAGFSDFWAPVGGGEDDLLGIAAVERFRPRGARGQIEAVVSFFDSRGEVAEEIVLPRVQYSPHGGDQRAVSSDGRYLYLIDRILNGILVVDTVERTVVGEIETPGCSYHAVHPVGPDTVYVPCWRTGEILEITVGDDGPEISGQAVAFQQEAQVLYDQLNAGDAGTLTMLTRFSEVITVDLSGGLPEEAVEPVDIVIEGSTVVRNFSRISADGSTAVISYAEGEDYEADPERFVVYDTATWTATGDLTLPEGVEEVADMLLSADGSSVWLLANDVPLPPETPEATEAPSPEASAGPKPEPTVTPAPDEEPETGSRIFTVALPTSEVTGTVDLDMTTSGRNFTALYLPVEVDG